MTRGTGAAELVPLEGEPLAAELISIGLDGRVTFRVLAAERTGSEVNAPSNSDGASGPRLRSMRLDELVRWGNPVAPRGQTIVVLADGGRLVTAAAWAGGAALRIEGDTLVVLSDTWGEVPLPRKLVRGIVFALRSDARDRERLEEMVRTPDTPPAEAGSPGSGAPADAVLLTNRDRVTGKVTALSGGTLSIQMEAGVVKLPLSRVEAVVFGGSRPSPVAGRQFKLTIGLHDGSLVYSSGVQAGDNEFVVHADDNMKLNGGSVKDVALLQLLGGRIVYLSDMEPGGYRHVPYLSIEWPYRRDRNVLGEPLAVDGKRYLKGIGMHSASRLTYRLEGKYRRFDAMVAVDDSAGKKGSVTFGVYVLREGEWQGAYASGMVRGGDAPRPVSVDVSSAQGLTLTVDFADRGDELDHADWLDARLVKVAM